MRHRARSKRSEATDPAWVLEGPKEPIALRRRRGDRRPVPPRVRVTEADLDVSFEAFDLCGDGVFLHSELLLSIGDELRLEIAREPSVRVVVEGRVVDVYAEADVGRGGSGAGVQVAFQEASLADREALLALAAST